MRERERDNSRSRAEIRRDRRDGQERYETDGRTEQGWRESWREKKWLGDSWQRK